MKPIKPGTLLARQREFASRLMLMKDEAGRLGLLYTMQKMEEPVTMVGYEIAGEPGDFIKQRNLEAQSVARIHRSKN